MWCKGGAPLHSFAYAYPVVLAPSDEETILYLLDGLRTLTESQLTETYGLTFGLLILFH